MEIVASGRIAATQFGLTPFDLARPTSLDQAVDAIGAGSTVPVFMAGGTDLFVQFRNGLRPDYIIDLTGIDELCKISVDDQVLSIGAGANHQLGLAHSDVAENLHGLSDAWALLGNVRVRGMGTLGGNLMARNHRYEGPLFAAALNGSLCFHGPGGESQASMADVWGETIAADQLLTRIDIPLAAQPVFAYDRSLRPIMTMAVVIEDSSSGGKLGRAVIGSEWNHPVTLNIDLTGGGLEEFAANAQDIAEATMTALPENLRDAAYLRAAGGAVLTRLIRRLGDSA